MVGAGRTLIASPFAVDDQTELGILGSGFGKHAAHPALGRNAAMGKGAVGRIYWPRPGRHGLMLLDRGSVDDPLPHPQIGKMEPDLPRMGFGTRPRLEGGSIAHSLPGSVDVSCCSAPRLRGEMGTPSPC
ncbi:hypothetical protein ACLOJK_019585 [Asimina triloba]